MFNLAHFQASATQNVSYSYKRAGKVYPISPESLYLLELHAPCIRKLTSPFVTWYYGTRFLRIGRETAFPSSRKVFCCRPDLIISAHLAFQIPEGDLLGGVCHRRKPRHLFLMAFLDNNF